MQGAQAAARKALRQRRGGGWRGTSSAARASAARATSAAALVGGFSRRSRSRLCRSSVRIHGTCARKAFGRPKRRKLAHAFLWEHSYKRLKLAQLLGQLSIFLSHLASSASESRRSGARSGSYRGIGDSPPAPAAASSGWRASAAAVAAAVAGTPETVARRRGH